MNLRVLCLALLSAAFTAPIAHAAIEFDSPVFYPTSGGTYDVALADVDLDGDLDVVSSNYDGQTVQVFLNTGLGAFAPPTMYASPWALFTLVRDLDADGYPDLATANFQGNTLTTRRNNGDGTFGAPLTFAAPVGTRCIAATDWNNDGDLELVVIGSNANEYRIYERSGPGLTYASIQSGSTGNLPKWVTVGDLDGDSRDEVVIVNAFGSTVSVLKSDWPSAPIRTDHSIGSSPSMVVLPDLNGDGIRDLAVVRENALATVRLGTGGGLFAPAVHYSVASNLSQGIVAADYDLDGDVDLVTANYNSNDVTVLANNGDGTFAVGFEYPCGSTPRGLTTGDLDGDGDFDLAVTNYVPPFGGGFAILRSTQTGSENRPQITQLEPAAGAPGQSVTIRGLRFTGAAEVRFSTKPALFTFISDTEIQTTVPPDARTGRVSVTTPEGSDSSPFDFIVRPVIQSFAPTTVHVGDFVYLSGYNFTGLTGAGINGVPATYTLFGDNSVRLVVPSGATTGPIRVSNPGGFAFADTVLVIVPSVGGGTINLSWDDCGDAGTEIKDFACNTNSGPPFQLVGSFSPPPGVNQFLGLSTQITVLSSEATVPDWWRFGNGQCRGTTALSTNFDFTPGPHSCADFFAGQAVGGYLYEVTYGSPNRARLLIQAAVPIDSRGPVSPSNQYYAYKVLVQRTQSMGECGGCAVPMSLRVDYIQLFQPSEVGFDPIITATQFGNTVTWQGGGGGSPPVIYSFTPTEGSAGTEVTVTGERFTGATNVRFGSLGASFIVDSDTQIRTVAPPGVVTAGILVITPNGDAASPYPFVVPGSGFEGINLLWNDCGTYGVLEQPVQCLTNTGAPFTMVTSFVPPSGISRLLGLEGQLEVKTSGVNLPDWWRHGVGECRGSGALTMSGDFTAGPYSCNDYWAGQAVGGLLYQAGFGGPDKAKITVQLAIPLGTEGVVHPDREYYGFKLNISRTKSTGAGSCLGCSEPACIVLNSIRLFQPDELGNNPVLVMPIESNYIKWGTPVGCPVATPVLASLVKAEAHPDRVTLEWMTEDITTARLERRTSGGAWSTLSELRAASDRRLRYEDREVAAGSSYDYRLATMAGGREIHLGETSVKVPVAVKSLALARAMGVDARTITVSLTLPKASAAKLELFDIGGRLRASRSLEGLAPGEHEVSFASSQPLGPGVYFVRLAQDGSKVSRRFSMTY